MNAEIGRTLFYARQYGPAIDQLRETLEINPSFWPAHLFLGWVYEQQGLFTEAIAILRHCHALDDKDRTRAFLGVACALGGGQENAAAILAQLIAEQSVRHVPSYYIAILCAAMGQRESALDWLEKACRDRSEWLVWMEVDPRFDLVRGDARFRRLLGRVRGGGEDRAPAASAGAPRAALRWPAEGSRRSGPGRL